MHWDKRTFTADTAIKKSWRFAGSKRPKEICSCRVCVPPADRLTTPHKSTGPPAGDTLKNSIKQKEVAASH